METKYHLNCLESEIKNKQDRLVLLQMGKKREVTGRSSSMFRWGARSSSSSSRVEMGVLRQADVRSKLHLIVPCEIRGSQSSCVFWDVFRMVASHPHFGRYFFFMATTALVGQGLLKVEASRSLNKGNFEEYLNGLKNHGPL